MTTTPLVIVGAGGFGREVLDVVEAINESGSIYDVLGFVDDNPQSEELLARRHIRLLGPVEALAEVDAEYALGIGSGPVRARLDELATEWGRQAALLVHPSATFGSEYVLGAGTVVTAGVRITTNIVIGRHVHLNLNTTVGHDVRIDDYVTVNPGATISGNVVLEREVSIGTNAAIIQGVTVGRGTIVGAGAVVVRDLPSGVTAVGVPARPLNR